MWYWWAVIYAYGGDNTLGISQKKNGPAVLPQYWCSDTLLMISQRLGGRRKKEGSRKRRLSQTEESDQKTEMLLRWKDGVSDNLERQCLTQVFRILRWWWFGTWHWGCSMHHEQLRKKNVPFSHDLIHLFSLKLAHPILFSVIQV